MQSSLPPNGLLRLSEILRPVGPIPMSASSWWAGVREKRLPQPIKLGTRMTCWRAEDIHVLIEKGVADHAE